MEFHGLSLISFFSTRLFASALIDSMFLLSFLLLKLWYSVLLLYGDTKEIVRTVSYGNYYLTSKRAVFYLLIII